MYQKVPSNVLNTPSINKSDMIDILHKLQYSLHSLKDWEGEKLREWSSQDMELIKTKMKINCKILVTNERMSDYSHTYSTGFKSMSVKSVLN